MQFVMREILNMGHLYPGIDVIMSRATYQNIVLEGENTVRNVLSRCFINLVDDEMWIDDIFHFQVIGGHTLDSSVLFFTKDEKRYVITGDECYLCANALENKPIGICANGKKNEEFIAKIHREKWIPLPFHDGELMEGYIQVSDNITQVV